MPLAESGDKAALQVFETCGRYLGIGIVNVANLFDISEVVVSASFDVSYILRNAQYALDVRKMNTIRREVKMKDYWQKAGSAWVDAFWSWIKNT